MISLAAVQLIAAGRRALGASKRAPGPRTHLGMLLLGAVLLGVGATEALVRFTEAILVALPSLVQ